MTTTTSARRSPRACSRSAASTSCSASPACTRSSSTAGSRASGIRHVTPRHEQGAGFMADGYGRVADRPGVCVVDLRARA